jgi:hypothetical protein
VPKHHAMETDGGVEMKPYSVLTSSLDGRECQSLGLFTQGERQSLWYLLYTIFEGSKIRSGCGGKDSNTTPLSGFELWPSDS